MKVECYEEIGDIMVEEVMKEEDMVSMIANLDIVWDVARYLEFEYDLTFDLVDVDRLSYDKEYYLIVSFDEEAPVLNIEKACGENGKYKATIGTVYMHCGVDRHYIKDVNENDAISEFNPIIWGTDEEEFDDDEPNFEFCMDKDGKGFCVCHECEECGFRKFQYRGNEILTISDINRILADAGWA